MPRSSSADHLFAREVPMQAPEKHAAHAEQDSRKKLELKTATLAAELSRAWEESRRQQEDLDFLREQSGMDEEDQTQLRVYEEEAAELAERIDSLRRALTEAQLDLDLVDMPIEIDDEDFEEITEAEPSKKEDAREASVRELDREAQTLEEEIARTGRQIEAFDRLVEQETAAAQRLMKQQKEAFLHAKVEWTRTARETIGRTEITHQGLFTKGEKLPVVQELKKQLAQADKELRALGARPDGFLRALMGDARVWDKKKATLDLQKSDIQSTLEEISFITSVRKREYAAYDEELARIAEEVRKQCASRPEAKPAQQARRRIELWEKALRQNRSERAELQEAA